jgi:cytochrome c-type biogenesis protein CcmH/NrfG
VLARAVNMLIARGAYREAARLYPDEPIELRQVARTIEKSR